jgi:CheY-like chemotaxis protein
VRLQARVVNNRALSVSVSDTGIGIKPEDHQRVFGEFEQVDSSYARQQQGTGLGLALTKRIVELHGGRIRVESAGVPGQGATLHFELPLNQALRDEMASSPPEPPLEPQLSAGGERPLILVVEDNPPSAELIDHYLQDAGYAVAHAVDGDQALRLAQELKPAAITLDIMLPRKDGWEVLTTLKSTPQEADIPVVIVSMTEDRQLAFSLGAVDFLVKPVEKERLREAVGRALALRQPTRSSPLVLVVDDESGCREMLGAVLTPEGYQVEFAEDGNQALRMIYEKLPDVVILDLMMPEMTGFDVAQRLREKPPAREVPIVIFSSKDISAEERERLAGAIRAVVPKSGKEELLRAMKQVVKTD